MAEELLDVQHLIQIERKEFSFGIMTNILNPAGLSSQSVFKNTDDSSIFVIHIYNFLGAGYQVVYLNLDKTGQVQQAHAETEGVLPYLFHAPDHSVWMSLTYTKQDGSKQFILPFFNRARIAEVKLTAEFVADLLGKNSEAALFYKRDEWKKKNDQIIKLVFDKNHLWKSKKVAKIEAPAVNHPYFTQENGKDDLQLLAMDFAKEVYIHRQIDLDGQVIRERVLDVRPSHVGMIKLSFTEDAAWITTDGKKLCYMLVKPDGSSHCKELITIPEVSEFFYGLYPCKSLGNQRFITSFFGEARGWLVVDKEGNLLECFVRSSEFNGYQDRVSGERIEFEFESPIISKITTFDAHTYSILFHPAINRDARVSDSNKMSILTRTI